MPETRLLSDNLWAVCFKLLPNQLEGAPAPQRVHLSGTFNQWDETSLLMERGTDDSWEARLELPEGEHLYKFILDGESWFPDPENPLSVDDPHHGKNSVLELGRLSGREQSFLVRDDLHWRAVSSPRRLEILEFLLSAAPCSTAELAEAMDVAADGLYHHIRILLKAGLVREVGEVCRANRTVPVFDVAARELRFQPDDDDRLPSLWRSLARRAERAIEHSGDTPHLDPLFSLGGEITWLNEERIEKVRTHLAHIKRLFAEGRQDRHGQLVLLAHLMTPVERTRTNSS